MSKENYRRVVYPSCAQIDNNQQVYEVQMQVPKCNSILQVGSHECQKLRDFLISTFLCNSHSKFPTIWTIFFNSQLHLANFPFCLFNSLILQYLPHVTHFPKSLPLSHFPQTVLTLPFIRPFVRLRRHILHQHLFLIQPMV
jgi:hypothetical protein